MSEKKISIRQTRNRQRIIDAAGRLIIEKGIENTSLADIAGEVGISKGTLYYYYASKNDLVFDITERHMNRITGELLSLIAHGKEGSAPEEILTVVLETLIAAETRGRLHLYLVREALTGNDTLKKRFRRKYLQWRDMLKDGLEKVAPHIEAPGYLAQVIIAVIDGLIIQSMLGETDIPLKGIARLLSR